MKVWVCQCQNGASASSPLSKQRQPTQACHLGGNSRFVDTDQPVWLKMHFWLTLERPLVSRGTHLFAPPFRSDQVFFICVAKEVDQVT